MVFGAIKKTLGKAYDFGKKVLGKASDLYKRGRSVGKHVLEHVAEKQPSLYKAGLEAIYNSPYGDKIRGAEAVLREVDSLADGNLGKKVEAIKSLGRMALKRDISAAGALEKGAESALKYVETGAERSGLGGVFSALSPVIREQLGRGIRTVREREEELSREARGGGRM
jgi:hypothetical protein